MRYSVEYRLYVDMLYLLTCSSLSLSLSFDLLYKMLHSTNILGDLASKTHALCL